MKRGFLLSILVLFLISLSVVSGNYIYEDYIYGSGTYEFEGNNFDVVMNNQKASVTINYDEHIILSVNQCSSGDKYEVCLSNYFPSSCDYCAFDYLKGCETCCGDVDDSDDENAKTCLSSCPIQCNTYGPTGEPLPAVFLSVQQKVAKIEPTRTFSEKTILIGDEITIATTIKNEGSERSQTMEYSDAFPDFLDLFSYSGSLKQGNTLVRTIPAINSGGETTFRYKVRGIAPGKASLLAQSVYFEHGEEIVVDTKAESVTVNSPLTFTFNQTSFVERVDSFEFEVTIKNIDTDDDYDFSAQLEFPRGTSVSSKEDMVTTNEHFITITDTLESEEEKTYVLQFDRGVGDFTVFTTYEGSARYTFDDSFDTSFKVDALTSETEKEDVTINIVHDYKTVVEEAPLSFGVTISNGWSTYVESISGYITFGPYNESFTLPVLESGALKSIDTYRFRVPSVDKKETFDVVVYLEYDISGETLSATKKDSVSIIPIEDVITLEDEITEDEENDRLQDVIISVTNNADNFDLTDVELQTFIPTTVYSDKNMYYRLIPELKESTTILGYAFPVRIPDQIAPIITSAYYRDYSWNITSKLTEPAEASHDLTLELVSDDVTEGQFSTVRLLLENDDSSETFSNIRIVMEPSPFFDFRGNREFEFDQIEPDESIEYTMTIRPKSHMAQFIGTAYLFYRDEANIPWRKKITDISLTANEGNVTSPLLNVSQKITIDRDDSALITFTLENRGLEKTNGTIYLDDEPILFEVQPSQSIDFHYRSDILNVTYYQLFPVHVSYDVNSNPVITTVYVDENVLTTYEQVETEEVTQAINETVVGVETIDSSQQFVVTQEQSDSGTLWIIIIIGAFVVLAIVLLVMGMRK